MILAKAEQQNRAIQIFKGICEKRTTSDLTTEEVDTVVANFEIIQKKIISVNEENAVNNMKVYIAILQKAMEMKVPRDLQNTIGAASEEDELRWNERLAAYNTQLH